MRKLVLNLHVSLDNVVSDPDQWMLMNDEILKDALDYYQTIDTVLFGSKTYPYLAEYWQRAEQVSDSNIEKEVAKKLNSIDKLVLSRSSVDIVWSHSKLLRFEDITSLAKSIENLRNQDGKDISIESGVGIWKLFLANNFFDELMLFVQPVIVGKGEKLYPDDGNKYKLKLIDSKIYATGVTMLHYSKI